MIEFVPYNDPILRQRAYEVPVELINTPYVQNVINQMHDVVFDQSRRYRRKESKRNIAGLAAPQIGIPLRIILVDLASENGQGHFQSFINPEIVWSSRVYDEAIEGCFSVPEDVFGIVSRPSEIKIRGHKDSGDFTSWILYGWVARVFQHERDHLDGIRFTDRIKNDNLLHLVEYLQRPEYYAGGWEYWPHKFPKQLWEEIAGMRAPQYHQGWRL